MELRCSTVILLQIQPVKLLILASSGLLLNFWTRISADKRGFKAVKSAFIRANPRPNSKNYMAAPKGIFFCNGPKRCRMYKKDRRYQAPVYNKLDV